MLMKCLHIKLFFSKQVRNRNNSHRVDYSCPYKFNFSKNGDVGHHKITFVMLNKISNFSYPSSMNKSNDISFCGLAQVQLESGKLMQRGQLRQHVTTEVLT